MIYRWEKSELSWTNWQEKLEMTGRVNSRFEFFILGWEIWRLIKNMFLYLLSELLNNWFQEKTCIIFEMVMKKLKSVNYKKFLLNWNISIKREFEERFDAEKSPLKWEIVFLKDFHEDFFKEHTIHWLFIADGKTFVLVHRLQTPREEIAFTARPKIQSRFLGTAKAYFVCRIFEISLIYAFIGCPQSVS